MADKKGESFVYFLTICYLLYRIFKDNETVKSEIEKAVSKYNEIINSYENQIKKYKQQIQNLIEKEKYYENVENEIKKLRSLINQYENKIAYLLEKEKDSSQVASIIPPKPKPSIPKQKPKTPIINIPKIIPGSKFNITGPQSTLKLFCGFHTWHAIKEKDGFDHHRIQFCHIPTLFVKKAYSNVYDIDILVKDLKTSGIDGIFLEWWPKDRQAGGPGPIAAAKKIFFIPFLDGDQNTFKTPDEVINEIIKIYNTLIQYGYNWIAYNNKRMFAIWRGVSINFSANDWKYIMNEVNSYVKSQEGNPLFFLGEGDFPDASIFDGFWRYTTFEPNKPLSFIESIIKDLYYKAKKKNTIFIPALNYMFDRSCPGPWILEVKDLGGHGKKSHELWKICKKYNTHNIINICSYNEHHECTAIMPGKHWANEIILDTKLKWWCKAEKQDLKECMYGDIIWGFYKGILKREPDESGFYWHLKLVKESTDKIKILQHIAKCFVNSNEFKNKVCNQYSIEEILEGFYIGLWDKPADKKFISSLAFEVRKYMSNGKSKAEALIKIFENTFITSSNFVGRI